MSDKLNAGFTGDFNEPATGLLAQAKQAGMAAKDEASALAITAQDHPVATGTILALIAAVAFGVGYVLGCIIHPTARYVLSSRFVAARV